jgi:ribosomal protein L11 methyltransferase
VIRLAVRVRRAEAELALAELLELAPAGVEEVAVSDEVVEYAVYGPPGELPALPAVEAVIGGALVSVSTSEVADDWSERWREFHQPLALGGRLMVRPPWIPASDAELDLVIDPGQAFGTGAHATTALCLELLLELPVPVPVPVPGAGVAASEPSLVDLGCGSGVLAILAARLGWRNVLALDFDPLAVEATRENARVNGVALGGVHRFDLRHADVPSAAVVLANLLAPLLLAWCARMAASARPRPELIIASGLLVDEADRVSLAFGELGYEERERRTQGDWAALLLGAQVL